MEWRTDKPERPGLYDCKVDGKRCTLHFKKCILTGRSYFLYVDGSDVNPNAKIEWRDGPCDLSNGKH